MNLESKIYTVIKRYIWLCVHIPHLWLSLLKNMTKTSNMKIIFFYKNVMSRSAKTHARLKL